MTQFTCKYCGYRFQPKKDMKEVPKKCPYCAREGFVENTSAIVKNILDEAGVR
ncbi:hypothetical protein JW968_00460 [Candidatus Woesearchaeota archaeon]|nr:hypothetical protein [Candidatus Woesearchaeota archaeon]